MAREGLSDGAGTTSFLGTSWKSTAITTRATMARTGIKTFLKLKVTVMSLETVVLLLGITLSSVGMPSSILLISARSSSAV